MPTLYIIIAIISFIGILTLSFIKPQHRVTSRLTYFSLALVALAIVFGDNRLVGHSFIGAGVLLAMIDIFRQRKISQHQ